MDEVRAVPWNGLTVASTFSGGGGSCTGYRMAGFRVVWANEFEPHAAESYAANHPETFLDTRDIREVRGKDILAAAGVDEVDLFDGSPPCQSFSTAGQRHKTWGRVMDHADGTKQRSDDLFFEYARLLGELRPRAFVAENVRGLVMGAAKGYYAEIVAALRGAGYAVRAKLLDAQWLGVPQQRQRVILVGVRDDLGLEPAFPRPLPYRYSFREAVGDLIPGAVRQVVGNEAFEPVFGTVDEPHPTITAGGPRTSGLVEVRQRQGGWKGGQLDPVDPDRPYPTVQAGQSLSEVAIRTQFGPRHVRSYPADRPAPTVNAAGINGRRQGQASVPGDGTANDPDTGESLAADGVDPVERRRLTIAEVKRLCSFPDDYELRGTYDQQWARLGNSVPPLMMRAVAGAVAEVLAART